MSNENLKNPTNSKTYHQSKKIRYYFMFTQKKKKQNP